MEITDNCESQYQPNIVRSLQLTEGNNQNIMPE